MRRLKNKNKKSAFTLIELLVVISIIGLLASIILTSTLEARQNSQDDVLIQNITTLGSALNLYYQDNGVYPYAGMTDPGPCIALGENNPGEHCILGNQTAVTAYYSATNLNALEANLKPYLPTLPPEITWAKGVPQTITLRIFDPTYNSGEYVEDLQSNTCYQSIPNSFFLWGELNNRSIQANLNKINSHGYFFTNMPEVPCP